MATSMQDEYIVHYPGLAAIGLTFLIGLMTQLFIVVVNIMDWVKGRPKTPVDQILTSLGITRILLHSCSFLNTVCAIYFGNYMKSTLNVFFDLIGFFANLSDIWLGTLFSVVFCMKICSFHNVFFLYLKNLISKRVIHLIVALVFFSICYVSLVEVTHQIITSDILLQNLSSNETQFPEKRHLYIFLVIENSVSFLIYCTSSILPIVSLCLHMNRMKSNSNVTTNLDSYYKAIQFMTLCLIGFILRVGSNVFVLCFYSSLDFVWIFIIWNSCTILNSTYLIYRTNKLSNRFLRIFHHGTNYMYCKKCSESNCENNQIPTISTARE